MAGKEIYTGRMLESLEDKIDEMVGTLQAHTIALGNINTAVGLGVTSLLIEPDITQNEFIVNSADVKGPNSASYTYKTIKFFADGAFTYSGEMKDDINVSGGGRINYSKNGGAQVLIASNDDMTYKPFTVNIPVAKGDVLSFHISHSAGGGHTATVKAGSKINYKIKDIVNTGAIVVV